MSAHGIYCAFCGSPRDQVELLLRSKIGGCPPSICIHCCRAIVAEIDGPVAVPGLEPVPEPIATLAEAAD